MFSNPRSGRPQPPRLTLQGGVTGNGPTAGGIQTDLQFGSVNSDVGTFGDATHVAQITVNAEGQVTAAADVPITAGTTLTFAHFTQQQPSGTQPAEGVLTITTFTDRIINTTNANNIPGASLASNHITLPAGTYAIQAFSSYNSVTGSAIAVGTTRLYNVTDSALILVGMNFSGGDNTGVAVRYSTSAPLQGFFTLAAPKALALQYSVGDACLGGLANGAGQVEQYVSLIFTKIA